MNSDIYSSVLTRRKLIILVLDNGGFAVINKLQNNTGNESFNNLFADAPTVPEAFPVDFAAHAAAMGANAVKVDNPAELAEAFKAAKAADKTSVIVMNVDAYEGWTTQGHTWWEVGTPEVSDRASVREKHLEWEATRAKQRRGV
jgi:3D-(3,5/4)-trihydroxycyclohexane-1,2-dione acylhydrolase (decyclizing)